MSELLFRAWDITANRYRFFDSIFNIRPYTEKSSMPQYESCPSYHELIIEKFTGLKDKFRNDKEVYEGDIYKWIGVTFAITIDSFHGNRFMFGKDILCRAYIEEGQYLGNIHENPEVLNAKKTK